jgi:hypothetical protein
VTYRITFSDDTYRDLSATETLPVSCNNDRKRNLPARHSTPLDLIGDTHCDGGARIKWHLSREVDEIDQNALRRLRRLMDRSGTPTMQGGAVFHSGNRTLAEEVVALNRQLGGVSRLRTREYHGDRGVTESYMVTVNCEVNPFENHNLASRYKVVKKKRPMLGIVDVQLLTRP